MLYPFKRKTKHSTYYYPGQEMDLPQRAPLNWKNPKQSAEKEISRLGRMYIVLLGVVVSFAAPSIYLTSFLYGAPRLPVTAQAQSQIAPFEIKMARGDLLDRNGKLLATNLPSVNLLAYPQKVKNAESVAMAVVQTFPDLSYQDVLRKLKSNKKVVYLKKRLTPSEHYEANRLGFPSLDFEHKETRIYPRGRLFSHLTGRTDSDTNGISGMEKALDGKLGKELKNVRLTVDMGVQDSVRTILQKKMAQTKAQGASAILMNAKTAEIIAMVTLPDFDPNLPLSATNKEELNAATKGVYEFGSVMKLFNAAIGLETKKAKLSDTFDSSQPIHLAKFTISDDEHARGILTLPDVLIRSSNVGSATIALNVGEEKQREYLEKFGFLNPLSVELPEKGKPLFPKRRGSTEVATASYGYGISVTQLHVVAAAAALVNGGTYRTPRFFIDANENEADAKKIISKKTSDKIRAMMRMVVLKGTGRRANVAGYEVGGKTGSARKRVNGKYAKNLVITSFLSAFPMDDPEYVLMVTIDAPQRTAETQNQVNAAFNVVPAAKEIIETVAPQLRIVPRPYEPTQTAPYVRRILSEN